MKIDSKNNKIPVGRPLPIALAASRNRVTGKGVFPPIPDSSPAAPGYEAITLSTCATLYSYTILHPNPKTGLNSIVQVYADFPEEVRVFGRMELPEGQPPKIGMQLAVVKASENLGYIFTPGSREAE